MSSITSSYNDKITGFFNKKTVIFCKSGDLKCNMNNTISQGDCPSMVQKGTERKKKAGE